jgi:acyl carrier protein
MDDVEQFVIDYLRSRPLTRSIADSLNSESRLMEMGALDSLGLMALVSRIEEEYGLALPDTDFVPENFETPDTIATMIKRLKASSK